MKRGNLIYLIPVFLVLLAGSILISKSSNQVLAQSRIEGGFQIVEVLAKNGFSPSITEARADTPTILRIKTSNTLDCSAALFIADLKYQQFLPSTGETEIQILPQKAGKIIAASCSMGMYGFEIRFV